MCLKKDVEGLFRWLHSALCNRYNTEATVIPGWGKVGTDINYPEGGIIVSGHLRGNKYSIITNSSAKTGIKLFTYQNILLEINQRNTSKYNFLFPSWINWLPIYAFKHRDDLAPNSESASPVVYDVR